MIRVEHAFSGTVLLAPVIIGALLSGIVYLAEGAAIPFTIFQIALIASIIFFACRQMMLKQLRFEVYGLEIYYLLFFALIFFSLIYSPEREEGLFQAVRMIVLFFMTYLFYNLIRDKKQIEIMAYMLIFGALIVAIYSIVQFYFNPEIAVFNYANQGKKLIRGGGTESDPNIFASNLIPAIMLLSAAFGYSKTYTKKFFLFGILGVLFAAVLLTYSRSSWVAIGIGLFVIMGIQRRYQLLLFLLCSFFIVLFTSETVQALTLSFAERFLDIFSGSSDDSSKFRILLAETALLIILDTYLIGVGYQGFSTAFQKYHPPQQTAGVYEPHNEFYAVFAELGLIGFTLFLVILWKIFRKAYEAFKLSIADNEMNWIAEGLFASFISYIIFFQFLGGMMVHSIFLITISLIFCAHNIAVKRSSLTDQISE